VRYRVLNKLINAFVRPSQPNHVYLQVLPHVRHEVCYRSLITILRSFQKVDQCPGFGGFLLCHFRGSEIPVGVSHNTRH
jgi:hypothetical protein